MQRKILAIDDSLTLREFINRALTQRSSEFKILLAKDGTEGLALAASEQPDLILLDFVLPDLKGDEVCRRLQANPNIALIPVILMSSSASDIKRTQAAFQNVVKAIEKPFTGELLCATVSHILRTLGQNSDAAAAAAKISSKTEELTAAFSGHTGQFSVASVLLALERDQLTGVLRLYSHSRPIELYVVGGRPVLATIRDVQTYLNGSTFPFTPPLTRVLNDLKQAELDDGCPVFMRFAEKQLMTQAEAAAACHEHGMRLFAKAWTAPRAHFEFESKAELPPLTAGLPLYDGVMSDWAMESLRWVGDEAQSALAWGNPNGIPAYTRRGYELIQQIPLNDEEIAFAGLIGPTCSLEQIAVSMGIDVESAQRILYRFLCLEIFDYWPASLLRAA